MTWTTKKPKFNKEFKRECILICASKISGEWIYSSYLILKIYFENKWYWGWCNMDGEEIDDIRGMRAQRYLVIEKLLK